MPDEQNTRVMRAALDGIHSRRRQRMKHSRIAAAFSGALAAAFMLGACSPAATTGTPALATVVVTSPPQVITQIVAGTPQTVEITSTPGPTQPAPATAPAVGSVQIN